MKAIILIALAIALEVGFLLQIAAPGLPARSPAGLGSPTRGASQAAERAPSHSP
jgi:hypothetical protein